MLNDLRSEIVNFDFSSPPTRGSSTGASVLGHSLGCSLLLRQTSTVPQLTVNSPEGLVDSTVPGATGGRSARSLSQGSASAVHLVSCHSVPQAPLTVPENRHSKQNTIQISWSIVLTVNNVLFLWQRKMY